MLTPFQKMAVRVAYAKELGDFLMPHAATEDERYGMYDILDRAEGLQLLP